MNDERATARVKRVGPLVVIESDVDEIDFIRADQIAAVTSMTTTDDDAEDDYVSIVLLSGETIDWFDCDATDVATAVWPEAQLTKRTLLAESEKNG